MSWNLAIAWDFIQIPGGAMENTIGSTGRYVSAHDDIAGKKFFLATSENGGWDFYNYGSVTSQLSRVQLFVSDQRDVGSIVDPQQVEPFVAEPPFALLMRRDLWQQNAIELADRYPSGRIRNVTPDGSRVVLEVPAA